MSSSLNVQKIRKDFPNLTTKVFGKPLVYLDNAATTLKPQSVIDAVREHYETYTSNVHRGVHYLSEKATAAYESTRSKIKAFINADSTAEIIFTKGTTEAINLVAQCYGQKHLKKGDEIIISEMEHHSNIVPWQFLVENKGCVLKVAPMNDDGDLIMDEFQKLFTPKTKFVSLVYISNSLGTVNPVRDVIQMAHRHNVPVLLDAAQAASNRVIDVQELDCDFLVFSAHKTFGPTGVGVLYGKKSLLNDLPPYQGGGDMISSVTFAKTTYKDSPSRFEAGTPNVAGVIGLGAAIDYIGTVGLDQITDYLKELLAYGTASLQKIPGLTLIGTAKEKTSILSFILNDVHAHDLGTLIDGQGVAIRAGHHCTQPVMEHFKIAATSRASLSIYNTKEDIDCLVKAILKAKEIFK